MLFAVPVEARGRERANKNNEYTNAGRFFRRDNESERETEGGVEPLKL